MTALRRPLPLVFLLISALLLPESASAQRPWKLYQFHSDDGFRYEIRHETPEGEQVGEYRMTLETRDGRLFVTVDASLGEMSCNATMPVSTPQAVPALILGQCMMIAPVSAIMFAPTWMILMGQSWELGSRMDIRNGNERFWFEITERCQYAGKDGLLARFSTSEGLEIETCVATDVPLPLAVSWRDETKGQTTRVWLTEYHR